MTGGKDELEDRAARCGDAEDFASEKSPAARQALVRFETLYFFE